MRNKNLIFFVQPSEAAYTAPNKLMKTYMNRFTIEEDDQVCDIPYMILSYCPDSKYKLNDPYFDFSLNLWPSQDCQVSQPTQKTRHHIYQRNIDT